MLNISNLGRWHLVCKELAHPGIGDLTNSKMKNTTYSLLLSLVPFAAYAGETVTVEPMPQPTGSVVEYSPLDWYVGASAGFLIDAEEGFFTGQIGREIYQDEMFTHSIFLEVGYSDLENDGNELDLTDAFNFSPGDSFTGDADIEATFIPVTLNYRLDYDFTPRLGLYIGAGAGAAFIDVDGEFLDPGNTIDEATGDSEASFFAQAFAGLTYDVTDSFELSLGARYMWIDDYSVTLANGNEVDVDDNDDVSIELGGRFKF